MKGKLKKTEDGWLVIICDDPHCWTTRWKVTGEEKTLPVYLREEDSAFILNEGKEVHFEKIIRLNEETNLREFYARIEVPPYVSDDFTIGPDGAFEMTDKILENLKQK
jgi:hypothetical protein